MKKNEKRNHKENSGFNTAIRFDYSYCLDTWCFFDKSKPKYKKYTTGNTNDVSTVHYTIYSAYDSYFTPDRNNA